MFTMKGLAALVAASMMLLTSIPAQAARCGGGHSSYKRSSNDQPTAYRTASKTNVYRWMADNTDYSDWYNAVSYAGLVKEWDADNGWTVFVPTNRAIAALPEGVWATLTQPENKALLADVMRYHVVNQPYTTRDWATTKTVRFWNGDEWAFVNTNGRYMLGNGYVIEPDLTVGRARVNVVDTVYLPMSVIDHLEDNGYTLTAWYPDARGGRVMSSTRYNYDTDDSAYRSGTRTSVYYDTNGSAMDRAGDDYKKYAQDPYPVVETSGYADKTVTVYNWIERNPSYSTWWNALDAAGMNTTLSGTTQYSVFVPTNDALAALPDGVWDTVMADKSLLRQVVNYNLVRGAYEPRYFTDGRHRIYTVYGDTPRFVLTDDGRFMVDRARVLDDGYVAANGRIYSVDNVLFPRTVVDALEDRGYTMTAWYDSDTGGQVMGSTRQSSGGYKTEKRHRSYGKCGH
jgi:uncharacterized surface protein with fasciclin (FAS1) repeats